MGFLFFLCLLNGGEVGVFETILIFLWGLVVVLWWGCGLSEESRLRIFDRES